MATTPTSAPAQRPSLQLVPSPEPLYRDPTNSCHLSVTPFRPHQKPAALRRGPADAWAEAMMREYLDKFDDGQGNFFLEREVVVSLLALGYNTGFGSAMQIEYAEAVAQA